MPTLHLRVHPSTPCDWIDTVTATVERRGTDSLGCRYVLRGDIERMRIPQAAPMPVRTDDLWRHTCFELFAREASGASYSELNFAPSGHWAAYRFDSYRQGVRQLPILKPAVTCAHQRGNFVLTAEFTAADFGADPLQIAMSAVLEDRDGGICYWALQHPEGRPDFHHDAGFVARV